ncbi:uncharacterized protein FOMMEDRAFT_158862 [Fomitiporia mediterranea MF3/22]|uniref:uncharacterized protein n=1 Tax=Fomitiporia mediterranea (strain MF3/22) TaxID=694068 RepID=UPI00044075CF|nr:uncharacterized protein FOMMEDRAFT_158862 [Fomitiporia mediterranea MF3/22]EJD01708.1 hypothetical protein FOMMEDRAFT_158862 [Fomitiporia mediterranea MF3/22]
MVRLCVDKTIPNSNLCSFLRSSDMCGTWGSEPMVDKIYRMTPACFSPEKKRHTSTMYGNVVYQPSGDSSLDDLREALEEPAAKIDMRKVIWNAAYDDNGSETTILWKYVLQVNEFSVNKAGNREPITLAKRLSKWACRHRWDNCDLKKTEPLFLLCALSTTPISPNV